MLLLNNLKYVLWIVLLVVVQVALFNNINFWGYSNPFFYVIFILLYPLDKNRYIFLFLAFILGLSVDLLEHTGGVNAFASVFVAYIRYYVAQVIQAGKAYESEEIKLGNFSFIQWVIYLVVLIFVHHFLVDFTESFKLEMIGATAKKSLIGSGLTLIMVTAFLMFFPIVERSEY